MRIPLRIATAWIVFVGVRRRALIWIFAERHALHTRRAVGECANFRSERQAISTDLAVDQVIAHRMGVAFGIAFLGSIGVCLTTIEPDFDPASRSIGTQTMAAAHRAGAIVSATHPEFEERTARDNGKLDWNRRREARHADEHVAEFQVAARMLAPARHHCTHAHGLCGSRSSVLAASATGP